MLKFSTYPTWFSAARTVRFPFFFFFSFLPVPTFGSSHCILLHSKLAPLSPHFILSEFTWPLIYRTGKALDHYRIFFSFHSPPSYLYHRLFFIVIFSETALMSFNPSERQTILSYLVRCIASYIFWGVNRGTRSWSSRETRRSRLVCFFF